MKSIFKTFMSAFLAGLCISIGAIVYLSVDSKIAGAVLFTVGLFAISTLGFNLYTGKVCYVFENKPSYAFNLIFIWLGNLAGTGAMAFLLRQTRVANGILEKAQALVDIKLNDSLLSLFILGMFCNMLIFIAVEGYRVIPHDIGRYLALFLGIMIFILCGFEHCVADMFYFLFTGTINLSALVVLLVITLGNSVGGVIFRLSHRYIHIETMP